MARAKNAPASRARGMSPFRVGVIGLVILVVAVYYAYTQVNPFASHYNFDAVFETSQNLKPGSPVRTAGVKVGVVDSVEPIRDAEGAALVGIDITDESGLPVHTDATLKIRPRIFLEGNSFVDLEPGSPSAEELDEDGTIPVAQTATPVSFGEILTSLQRDTRADLRNLFEEYGFKALGGGGAEGFNRSIKYWEDAYRDTALANGALLGEQEGDLSRVISGQQRVFEALSRSPEDLKNLVTNFNRTAAALASEESALSASVPALRNVLATGRPALQSLNATLPQVNEFARDALPGTLSSQDTIPATFPFIRQARLLFRPSELRGLAADLVDTIPSLTRLNAETVPFLRQGRALSRCQNQTILPFARDTDWTDAGVDGGAGGQSGEEPFKQFPRSLEGLSGESREHDANSPIFRVLGLGGPETVINFLEGDVTQPIFGATPFKVNGVQPPSPLLENGDLDLPVHRPDVPCEDQVPPDLNAPTGVPPITVSPETSSASVSDTSAPEGAGAALSEFLSGGDQAAPGELTNKLQREVDRVTEGLSKGDLDDVDSVFGSSKSDHRRARIGGSL